MNLNKLIYLLNNELVVRRKINIKDGENNDEMVPTRKLDLAFFRELGSKCV